jgi:hypothetical protein
MLLDMLLDRWAGILTLFIGMFMIRNADFSRDIFH